jgi:HEAT repeat protein
VLVLFPSVFGTTLVKISDNAVQFSIFEATVQLLYFPLADRERDGARATLEAAVKPIGYALAGVSVLLLAKIFQPTSLQAISRQSWFVLPLIGIWIAVIPAVRKRYVATLEQSLQKRRVAVGSAPVFEAASRVALIRSARTDSPKIASFAIAQLVDADVPTARAEFAHWCARSEPEIRMAALEVAPRIDDGTLGPLVEQALDDQDARVAVAAVHAFAQLHGELCVSRLERHLDDPRVDVQEAVMVALLQHGALEGVLRSGSLLELWSKSEDPALRRRAMEVLGYPGVLGAGRIVRRLLDDSDPSVRRAAIGAAASSGVVLLPQIVAALETPATLSAATNAIVRIGPAACGLVKLRFDDTTAPRNLRLHLPRVLAQLATEDAFQVLIAHLRDPDEWIRQKVLASASRMHRAGLAPPLSAVKAADEMQRELQRTENIIEQYELVRNWFGMILLDRWMAARFRKALVRVLRLAELSANGGARVAPVREAVFDQDSQRRSRALEVLDDVFGPNISERFARCLDRLFVIRNQPVTRPSGPRPSGAAEFVHELWTLPDAFAKVLALDASQFRGISLAKLEIAEGLAADDATIRELTALVVVTFKPTQWRELLTPLLADPDEHVVTYVRFALETGQTGMHPEDEMYTTLEKVLYLQRIALFSEVDPENLMALARAAEVHRSPKGTILFRAGDRGHALFVVIEGRVQTKTSTGRLQEYGEGEAFGELSVLDGSVRSDDAEVIDDAIILQIAREDFVETLRENGPLAESVIRVLVQRLRALRVQ